MTAIEEFIAAHPLGFTCEKVSPRLWRCRITCGPGGEAQRGMDFFHLSSTEPTLADALTRLAKAAHQHVSSKLATSRGLSANRDLPSFYYWCMLYGFDPKSQKHRKRYVTRRRRAEQLKYVIGKEAYTELLALSS